MNTIFKSLFRADLLVQWRNRRAVILTLIVPVIILISWKGVITQFGAGFALSSCITFGLVASGLMGYTNALARDREKGVLERLRVTPASARDIMMSRITVQLLVILLMTIVVCIVGYFLDHIALTPFEYFLTLVTSLVGGTVYLSLGQAIVGRIASADTVNAATRLIYFAFILVGAFGELGVLGTTLKDIVDWSPYGTVKMLVLSGMQPGMWNGMAWLALLVTLVYTALFAFLGIKWFKWRV